MDDVLFYYARLMCQAVLFGLVLAGAIVLAMVAVVYSLAYLLWDRLLHR